MDIIVGGAYQYLPENMRCTVDEVSRVSGRARITLDSGKVVHEVASHELGEASPVVAPETPAPAAEPVVLDETAEAPQGLTTPEGFRRRLRGDRDRSGEIQAP